MQDNRTSAEFIIDISDDGTVTIPKNAMFSVKAKGSNKNSRGKECINCKNARLREVNGEQRYICTYRGERELNVFVGDADSMFDCSAFIEKADYYNVPVRIKPETLKTLKELAKEDGIRLDSYLTEIVESFVETITDLDDCDDSDIASVFGELFEEDDE